MVGHNKTFFAAFQVAQAPLSISGDFLIATVGFFTQVLNEHSAMLSMYKTTSGLTSRS